MNITIKIQTTQRTIITYIKDKGKSSVRAISRALEIPKSTVQNHLKWLKKRRKHPESSLWDTTEGEAWLRLFVFSTLYHFGLTGNTGADRLSLFFKKLRIETVTSHNPQVM